jgi:hypothetical protein
MPGFYKIDKELRLVLTSAFGVLTRDEILTSRQQLLEDPDFDPSYSQVQDYSGVTKIELTADDVRSLAQASVFSSQARRALVVKDDLQFGLSRMFGTHRESAGEMGIRVFRNLHEAVDWVLSKKTASGDGQDS